MYSSCATLKPLTHLGKGNKDGFWGEENRGSLNNPVWTKQMGKSLISGKRGRKIKPGVAYSVLTRENKEALVNTIHSIYLVSVFWLISYAKISWIFTVLVGLWMVFADGASTDVGEAKGKSQKCGCNHPRRRLRRSTFPTYKQNCNPSCKKNPVHDHLRSSY